MVLFVTSLANTEFLETFLQQRHDKLASLQVLCWQFLLKKMREFFSGKGGFPMAIP